jgi:hypothetical protein
MVVALGDCGSDTSAEPPEILNPRYLDCDFITEDGAGSDDGSGSSQLDLAQEPCSEGRCKGLTAVSLGATFSPGQEADTQAFLVEQIIDQLELNLGLNVLDPTDPSFPSSGSPDVGDRISICNVTSEITNLGDQLFMLVWVCYEILSDDNIPQCGDIGCTEEETTKVVVNRLGYTVQDVIAEVNQAIDYQIGIQANACSPSTAEECGQRFIWVGPVSNNNYQTGGAMLNGIGVACIRCVAPFEGICPEKAGTKTTSEIDALDTSGFTTQVTYEVSDTGIIDGSIFVPGDFATFFPQTGKWAQGCGTVVTMETGCYDTSSSAQAVLDGYIDAFRNATSNAYCPATIYLGNTTHECNELNRVVPKLGDEAGYDNMQWIGYGGLCIRCQDSGLEPTPPPCPEYCPGVGEVNPVMFSTHYYQDFIDQSAAVNGLQGVVTAFLQTSTAQNACSPGHTVQVCDAVTSGIQLIPNPNPVGPPKYRHWVRICWSCVEETGPTCDTLCPDYIQSYQYLAYGSTSAEAEQQASSQLANYVDQVEQNNAAACNTIVGEFTRVCGSDIAVNFDGYLGIPNIGSAVPGGSATLQETWKAELTACIHCDSILPDEEEAQGSCEAQANSNGETTVGSILTDFNPGSPSVYVIGPGGGGFITSAYAYDGQGFFVNDGAYVAFTPIEGATSPPGTWREASFGCSDAAQTIYLTGRGAAEDLNIAIAKAEVDLGIKMNLADPNCGGAGRVPCGATFGKVPGDGAFEAVFVLNNPQLPLEGGIWHVSKSVCAACDFV